MNRKETLQALTLLDECIDRASQPEVMLALDALRRRILSSWQKNHCSAAQAEPLLRALDTLVPALREERPPTLPMQLNLAAFALYPPATAPAQDPIAQCHEQADHIRSLRGWQDELNRLLTQDDEETIAETHRLLDMQLTMMTEVFTQLLAMARSQSAARTARRRARQLEELAAIRESLCPADLISAQAEARTVALMNDEKFSSFTADITAPPVLLQVKASHPAAESLHRPEEETEE